MINTPVNKNSSGFGLIGILIVVAVIAAVSGGGLYLNEQRKQQSLLKSGSEAIQKAKELKEKIEGKAATEIDTSNWKTYRNERYGFEVKYPKINSNSGISISLNKAEFSAKDDVILIEVKNISYKEITYAESLCHATIFGGKIQKFDEGKRKWETWERLERKPCFSEIVTTRSIQPDEVLRDEISANRIFSNFGEGYFKFVFADWSTAEFVIVK